MTDAHLEVGLVSCVNSKRDAAANPRDLYTSAYFEKMRNYADQAHDDWWILSAKHGLLHPDSEPIDPYDETLTTASVSDRKAWAENVATSLENEGLMHGDVALVLHAGNAYSEYLVPLLEASDVSAVRNPTDGLRIGERMAWYNEHL